MSLQLMRYIGISKLNKDVALLLRISNPIIANPLLSSPRIIRFSQDRLINPSCASFSTSRIIKYASSGSETTSTSNDVDPTNVSGKKKKYWRSFGFEFQSEEADRAAANYVMFTTVTLGLVVFGFLLAYMPDIKYSDWSQREAFIEIARREALGLPHIDPNLVPPENINLPTEEELGDFEVII